MRNLQLGKKIANYRHKHNLTIKELSDKSGVSTALLSQLERDLGNPSLSVLQAIAKSLDMSLSSLLEEEIANSSLICRHDQRRTILNSDEKHILYDVLTTSPVHSNIELLLLTLAANTETYGEFSQHQTEEEIAYILQGEVSIIFESEEFLLQQEDSIRILPGRKHRFKNQSNEQVKILFVKSPVRGV